MTKLVGKNILITAGAQGIGEAISKHLIDSGANVAIHYFSSSDSANQLVEYATEKGQTGRIQTNRDRESTQKWNSADEIFEHFVKFGFPKFWYLDAGFAQF